jgi:UTP-glucose-1-phosphate uridylyltransferase
MKPTLLILAAGMGSRYGGLKQTDPIGPNGEAIIDYSIFDAIRAGFGKVVFVIRESFAENFKASFEKKLNGKITTEYVYQELSNIPEGLEFNPERQKPWGTGHAVLVARGLINEAFAVINADDFYGAEAYRKVADFLTKASQETFPHYAMVGYRLDQTLSDNGYVSRGVCSADENGHLIDVVEHTSIERKGDEIIASVDDSTKTLAGNTVVSMNFWGFLPSYFNFLEKSFANFIVANKDELKAEFYIPYVVNELIRNKEANIQVLQSSEKWFGVTYQEDKNNTIENINRLIKEGKYPAKLW